MGEKTGMLLLLSKDLTTTFFMEKNVFCQFPPQTSPKLRLKWLRGWRQPWPIWSGRRSRGKISTCSGLPGASILKLKKVGKKKILLRFLFLVVGSGFLAHWKNLAFTQNQDDKLVSIIGGEAYMNIYIVRAKCWLDVKQEWMGDPHKYW